MANPKGEYRLLHMVRINTRKIRLQEEQQGKISSILITVVVCTSDDLVVHLSKYYQIALKMPINFFFFENLYDMY